MRRFRLPTVLSAAVVVIAAGSTIAFAAPGSMALGPASHMGGIAATTVESTNWAGYAASGSPGAYSSVGASWTQPAVTCAAGEYSFSSYWVGLDGYNSRTVEQIGTSSDCRNGKPTYYAWYEAYPKLSARCTLSVSAGDSISASVTYRSGGLSLSLSDGSATCAASERVNGSIARSSAEVIVEAPSSNHGPVGTLGLADFGTVSFTGASANGGTLAGASPDKLIMGVGDHLKARPSKLSGGRFSVRWLSH